MVAVKCTNIFIIIIERGERGREGEREREREREIQTHTHTHTHTDWRLFIGQPDSPDDADEEPTHTNTHTIHTRTQRVRRLMLCESCLRLRRAYHRSVLRVSEVHLDGPERRGLLGSSRRRHRRHRHRGRHGLPHPCALLGVGNRLDVSIEN